MRERTYLIVTACIFGIVAAAHLTRLLFQWPITLGTWIAPIWISLPGVLIPAWIAWQGAKLARAEP